MKADQLTTCALCGEGIIHGGVPIFYRVTVEHMGIDQTAVRQVIGLSTMLGSQALAQTMGTNPDIAKPLGEPVTNLVCQRCALTPAHIARLAEAHT